MGKTDDAGVRGGGHLGSGGVPAGVLDWRGGLAGAAAGLAVLGVCFFCSVAGFVVFIMSMSLFGDPSSIPTPIGFGVVAGLCVVGALSLAMPGLLLGAGWLRPLGAAALRCALAIVAGAAALYAASLGAAFGPPGEGAGAAVAAASWVVLPATAGAMPPGKPGRWWPRPPDAGRHDA